jgi:predicted DNA-binding protein (UPF0251 family)
MGRQPLWRRVGFLPRVTYFKPAGVPMAEIQEVRLSIEEAEAIRLKDVESLEQDACAQKMNVSRSTFARILLLARQKMANALLNGKAIRIEGGNYELTKRSFRCGNGHEWEVPFEIMIEKPPELCPTCNTSEIMSLWPWRPGFGGGRRLRGRRNR